MLSVFNSGNQSAHHDVLASSRFPRNMMSRSRYHCNVSFNQPADAFQMIQVFHLQEVVDNVVQLLATVLP